MNLKIIGLIFMLTAFISCGTSFGKKKTFGNLEIFYSDNVPVEYVEKTGQYFVDHDLVLDHRHSIKLTSNHKAFVLKMILNQQFEQLPTDMERDLDLLESDINAVVFTDLNFEIEVCDANFYPLNLKH